MPERSALTKEDKRLQTLTAFVKAEAQALGFDLCRITRPDSIPEAKERLGQFIDAGRHGTMEWMAETRERRGDPRTLWSDVKSVVVFAMNYGPEEDPRGILEKPDKAAISVYARNRDYHDIIKGRLNGDRHAVRRARRRRREGVRRYRPRHGKAAGGRGRARLAGQAHQSRQPRAWLLAISRLDVHHGRPLDRRARDRSLRLVPGLSRRLPDGSLS